MASYAIQDTSDLGATLLAGDSVNITGKDTGNITDITANIDQSGLGSGGLAELYVGRNFRAQLGSAASPFKCDFNYTGSDKIFRYDAAVGDCYYTPGTCNLLRVTGPGCNMHLVGTGTVNTLEQRGGNTIVGQSITATTVRSAGGYMLIDGAAGANPTDIYSGGVGRIKTLRGFTNAYIFGQGLLIIDCDADNLTKIEMTGGSLDIVGCGNITTLNLYDGDAGRIRIGRKTTITTVNYWPTVRNVLDFLNHHFLTITTKNPQIDKYLG